jgi:serine/threonine protein kinase
MTEETLFHEALAKPLAERAAFLEKACAGQPELRAAVERLLAAHEASGNLLDRPAVELGQTVDSPPPQLTSTTDYRPSVEPSAVIAGRYTLVQKIGEGGMGEVWVAKQTEPVKRKVALKLIKAGMDSRAVVARFEHERQALAMMDHPNIARVLDGGLTPTGQPFFVMELVNGLALSKFCDQLKLSLRERLEVFVPICQAVQHAHYKGIVHRDLKPANILVTLIDARPVPKVIDFGVAKATGGKLTDESMATQFGAIVGTLEYISPEQAGYSGMDIDTRADIYSLGVILYELLTGLRPIDAKRLKKAAYTEMIRIIQEEDPAKPSDRLSSDEAFPSLAALRQTEPGKLMALLRGELDWVVMKCLNKQRERRYETANGLAADIQRYLADEAVEARPPSIAYRLSKFLKRHKGPVLAASLLLLALLGGIAGTTWGMIWADRALAAEAERVTERDAALAKLTESQEELLKSNGQLVSSVARSLLRPLAVQVQPKQPLPPLNDQEIEVLRDLSSSKDERLRLRFVEVALHDPVSTRRLKDRAAFAFQAAVGLNGTLRMQVEELLGQRLQAKEIPLEEQGNVSLCLTQLGVLDRPLARRTAATLTLALSKTSDPFALRYLAEGLAAVAPGMEPKEAGEAAATLTLAMAETTNPGALWSLSQSLSTVAARMEPKNAAQACGQAAATLTQAMGERTVPGSGQALSQLSQSLSAMATRMEPKEGVTTLTQAMGKTMGGRAVEAQLSQSLSEVAARMQPKEAAEATATFIQGMIEAKNPRALWPLSQSLSMVAARMEPKQAAAAAASLIHAMANSSDQSALANLAQALSAVATRLEAKEAAEASVTLIQALRKPTIPEALEPLAVGLSAMAARMEPKQAAQACRQAAATLTQALRSNTKDPLAWLNLAQGLAAVAARMEPPEAAQACGDAARILTQAIAMMGKSENWNALRYLAQGLAAVATRMNPEEAAQASGQAAVTLAQGMSKTNAGALLSLYLGLSAVSDYLGPKEAAQAAATLTEAMTHTRDQYALSNLAQGLSALAARMEPKEGATILSQAIGRHKTDLNALRNLAQGLSKVADRMEPQQAAEACQWAAATLIVEMRKVGRNTDNLRVLALGLSAVAARMEPQRGAAILIQAMGRRDDPFALTHLAQGLSAVAARMEPKDAAEAAALLSQAMDEKYPVAMSYLVMGLAAVAVHMEPKKAAQVCGQAAVTVTRAMSEDDTNAVGFLERGLSALAAHLEPKKAAEAAALLTQAMDGKHPNSLMYRAMGLSVLATCMEPKEAAVSLTQAVAKMDTNALAHLAEGLSTVATRMEPKETAEVAATLTQAMGRTTNQYQLQLLVEGLAAVLFRQASTSIRERLRGVPTMITALGGPGLPFAALASAKMALEPMPPPLSPQTLVGLLKQPFCVGEARRLVLEQLSRHYHRSFADQWEFVEYVHKHKLALDLTTPPQRPPGW